MIKNYLTIALRNLRRHKGYTFINVAGLAVGIACCLLIALYVQGERSYDAFHTKADRIYRLNKVVTPTTGGTELHAITSGPMGPTMVSDYPEVQDAVRVLPWFDDVLMTRGETGLTVSNFVLADSTFFDVFDFDLLRGDPETALAAPLSVVLSEETARKFFGDEDPMGQTLVGLNGLTYTVTGLAENPPANSHLRYDVLASWSSTDPAHDALNFGWLQGWFPQAIYTYLLLRPDADAGALEQKFADFMERHFPQRVDQYELYLQPLSDIYLHSTQVLFSRNLRLGNVTYVYVFSAIAVLLLLIACVNFMNLATARATKRAREVGVRKVLGAHRKQLVRQFLGESMLLSVLGVLIAVALVELAKPFFTAFAGTPLVVGVWDNPVLLGSLLAITLFVGLASGLYPAVVLSGFRPLQTLRGTVSGQARGHMLRNVLVATQFAISIALIVGTGVVYKQMQYMQTKDLGFRKEQIVVLKIGNTAISKQGPAFKNELLQHPNIIDAAGSNTVPGRETMSFSLQPEGMSQDEGWTSQAIRIDDYDLLETYDMEMAAGRYFSEQIATDSTQAIVINEALARSLGWENPVGKRLDVPGEVEQGTVIGVIKNFHTESLRHAVDPLFLYVAPRWDYLSLRISGEDIPGTLDYIRTTWERFDAQYPFEYSFLDETFAQLHASEQRLMQTLGLFSVLAVLIACLGLFGLAAFTAEQRTKEIGVRKVLGASVPSIVALLSKNFLKLVGIAFIVGAPVAYVAMQRWLADFAYRIELSGWIFLGAGLTALGIALATVSYQAIKAALADPVKSLRYE